MRHPKEQIVLSVGGLTFVAVVVCRQIFFSFWWLLLAHCCSLWAADAGQGVPRSETPAHCLHAVHHHCLLKSADTACEHNTSTLINFKFEMVNLGTHSSYFSVF
jgi:hypothetical protein